MNYKSILYFEEIVNVGGKLKKLPFAFHLLEAITVVPLMSRRKIIILRVDEYATEVAVYILVTFCIYLHEEYTFCDGRATNY